MKRPVRKAGAKTAPARKKPTQRTKKEATPKHNIETINIELLGRAIEDLEEEFDLTANTLVARKRFSTGILALDMQWGGGMTPGMYTIAGIEKAGKSTILTSIFGRMVKEKIPICHLRDAEGTVGVDIEYTKALLGNDVSITKLLSGQDFGKTDNIYKPRIHLEQSIEKTYEFFRAVLDLLPDKFYSAKEKCWMFRANDDKQGQAQMALLGKQAEIFKVKKGGRTKLYAYTNSDLIGFMAIDSYVALMPDVVEETGKRGKQMSQEAAAFAKSLPLIVGGLVKKGFVVLGAQQLRQNPSDQYNPWNEPGGNALKQYSQVREWIHAVSPSSIKTTPALWQKGDYPLNGLCKEKSVEEPGPNDDPKEQAYDFYQMVYLQNKKNKTATPYNRIEIRIWTRDRNNFGRGIDPVFDTWFYLSSLGMATVHARRVTCEKFFGDKSPYFEDFKRLIIAEEYGTQAELVAAWKKIDPKAKPVKIRKWCFADLRRRTNADADVTEKDMFQEVDK